MSIFGEPFDNSFDADATQISMSIRTKGNASSILIQDNGSGCANPLCMIQLGKHVVNRQKPLILGRYGVGLTKAAVSAADGVAIKTVRDGIARHLSLNWKVLQKQERWVIEDPSESPTAEPNGTLIVFQGLRSKASLNDKQLEKYMQKLALQYMPAIRSGKQILVNGKALPVFQHPEMEHQKTADLDIDGHKARVTMGLVPEGRTIHHPGLFVSFGYRVIEFNSRLGLGDDPTPGLCGEIELGDQWGLGTLKNRVIDDRLQALSEEIHRTFSDVIEKARRRGQRVVLGKVSDDINRLLRQIGEEEGPKKKARRPGPKNPGSGTKKSTGLGSPHRRSLHTQPGDRFKDLFNRASALAFAFANLGADGPAYKLDGNCVLLNADIPAIAMDPHNEVKVSIHAIHALATYWIVNPGGFQLRLFEEEQNAFDRISRIVGYLMTRLELTANASDKESA